MNYGHDLSTVEGRADVGAAFSQMRKITREPSHAERAKTLVAQVTVGSLATIARRPEGYPFGSTVDYALDATGCPVFSLSNLAEHTKNLKRDPRASLLVCELERPEEQRLAAGRVTLVGNLVARIDSVDEVRDTYLEVHPTSLWVDFGDFTFYSLEVEAVRYVGGFGAMSWVRAEDYLASEPDPLRRDKADIITHMNDDHVDAMIAIASAEGHAVDAATMVDCDRYGFDLDVAFGDKREGARFSYGESCDTPDATRVAMIRMVREAREKLAHS